MGLPWYKPENFLQLKTMLQEGSVLQDSYTDWLASAQIGYEKLVAQGNHVIRAYIDPIAFPLWCRSRGLRMDSRAQGMYAAIVAQQTVGGELLTDTFQ